MDTVVANIFANETLGWALFLIAIVGGVALLFLGLIYTKWQVQKMMEAERVRAEDYKELWEKAVASNEKLLDVFSSLKPAAESTVKVLDNLSEVQP